MSKSPLNFGLFGGARAALRSGRGRKQLSGRINKLENQVGVLMKDRHESMDPVEMGTQQPMYATSVQGDVADNVIQANDLANDQLASQGIQPLNAFSPETQNTAGAMFGSSIPGSFDRDMGMSPLNNKKSSKTEVKKEKPLTDTEKKRLHAVSSINYDKVVASGGVDLGIIKNKKKK